MKKKIVIVTKLTAALMLFAMNAMAQQGDNKPKRESSTDVTVVSNETTINTMEDGHRYRIRLSGDKIVELYRDNIQIPESDYPKYETMIRKIMIQLEKDREQAAKDRVQAEKDRQQADLDRKQADKDRAQADKDREQADKDRAQAELDRKQADQHRKEADQARKLADKEREQADKHREQAVIDRRNADADRAQADKDRIQADKDRKQAEIDRKHAEEDRKLMDEMLEELVNEKVVGNRNSLKSVVLDKDELTVNGVKQSDSLHSRFKSKYLKNAGGRISFNIGTNIRSL